MKRFLTGVGVALGLLLLAAGLFFLWASSGRLAEDELAQTKTYPAAPASADRDTFTVTTYNLGYLSGMTNNEPVVRSDSLFHANMDRAVDLLRALDPDVVAFQEIDFGGARSAYVHQPDTIATRLGYAGAAQAVNWDERYLPFPYGRPAVHFGSVRSGQALLSRSPIREQVRHELVRPSQPFFRDAFYLSHLAQMAVVDLGGTPLILLNVHLEAFDTATREQQARTVNDLYKRLARQEVPILLLGDVNSVMPAALPGMVPEQRRRFVGDETMGVLLEGTDLAPAVSEEAYEAGPAPNTFPAEGPTRKLDHIFYRPRFITPLDTDIQCGAPQPPSDHCALALTFTLSEAQASVPSTEALPPLDSLLGR